MAAGRPHITVVGLGPAGADLLGEPAASLLAGGDLVYLRTARHPAAAGLAGARTLDHHYESGATFDDVYTGMVDEMVEAAQQAAPAGIVYAVPGSPQVAERTVELLRADARVDVSVVPALSFVDLAWVRVGVDPFARGVTLVDAAAFAEAAAGGGGPFLVGQCWSRQLLSDIKLGAPDAGGGLLPRPVVLHHLGLADEVVTEVDWWELDRTLEPDHLTSVYVPALPLAGTGAEVARLRALMDTLRRQCPWDRAQTHASLMPHLVEECYEVLDALGAVSERGDATADAHLEEELGDLLFQIVFHARLAHERGAFDLDDVARGIHDKLVHRHPHVFGDVEASTPDAVVSNWEAIKKSEKGRRSVTEGIPTSLPALMLANKLARKARSVGLEPVTPADDAELAGRVAELSATAAGAAPHPDDPLGADNERAERLVGDVLFVVADLAQRLGIDAEQALRARALQLRGAVMKAEGVPEDQVGSR
jgi:tetrapyrrole methylase family protein/MazG family protein